MKHITLTSACAALLFACAIANAQTSSPPSSQPNMAPVTSQSDTIKGNDVVGTTVTDQTATPPSAGQDKSTGNDLVSPKGDTTSGGMKQGPTARPNFNTLDASKAGALTANDVKGNKWLSKNFTRCDTNHDGSLSREEYAACK
jgi:hypothetical protein